MGMLDFDGAAKRFGAVMALDGCTFAARPGRLTGFLGPNGAGKTTAMRAVFGLVELDAGTVRWHGRPVSAAERARFGYMPEERGLYPRMGVQDQLVYLGELCGRAADDVSRGVYAWLERLGLADRAADRLDALSHGNQQRVQLIAALVNDPDLLVLDEPFAGLDPIAMGAMSELLAELAAGGATVLFSSHQLDLVEDLCQDVVIIDHGRIVLAGELAGLRAKVPQRFVDIRYRGPAPDWTRLAPAELVESTDGRARLLVGRDADLAAVVAAAAAAPISSRSPTSRRRCRSCSARRWRHERRAAGLAGGQAGDTRAEPLEGLPGRARDHARPRGHRHRGGREGPRRHRHPGCRLHRRHPRRAALPPSSTRAKPSM